ncbi:Glucose-6-phosphate 1-dehydrogenase [Candidatus Protochlamydia naegleriophila]|uniref:Glucose-6-phosphate 1-dehydrogenase n=2 Tax=Candidatus Protochlamydia naegleriophila TaxID=389348 RepID=A0A0U5J993_9BACT|nr:Glucose-6-phosphate 1-dehydrogenase [Candidatus Protochlamydia naegleriophila]
MIIRYAAFKLLDGLRTMMSSHSFANPLTETNRSAKIAESCILVIFGATGDLTARKLVPALYNLAREGQLPAHFACVGFARRPKNHDQFREEMLQAVNQFSRSKPVDQELWKTFREQLYYHQSEFDNDEGYESLNRFLQKLDSQMGTKGNRVFYLSIQPSYFTTVVEKLSQHHLTYPVDTVKDKWSRVIIEKPFGEDLDSARQLQQDLMQHLNENQIYRIDHYLGKETVQNLLVFRFGNPIFESVWNNHHIDNIQITVGEEIGIGTRGRFWEEAGMLRDIVQNHMMQLLSMVAMEPPTNLSANAIRDEKVKVIESIRPIPLDTMDQQVIRGQYGPGFINGEPVKGYREEDNVNPESFVETYVAMQLSIDNWRWAGVPFYLRAGKRLPKRATEIAITFKKAPGYLFEGTTSSIDSNVLVIRIQPDEGISLRINCKVPALNTVIQPVKMDFRYGSYFGAAPPEAYERLICDCMAGDNTLFARDDEVIMSWKLLTPVLEHWQETTPKDFPNYAAGTWGPEAAEEMLKRQGRHWRLI